MSQYQSADLNTGFFAERAAVWIGWALLAAFATVLLVASFDKQHRRQLESYEEVTAVGDRAFFKPTEAAVVTFKGQPLFPVTPKHVSDHDSRMIRAGEDDSGAYRIYLEREPSEGRVKGAADYFLKLGPDEYLNIRPAPAGK